ncbi:MAG: extracellular solute-binding protein [Catenulispora sp.]|nr:extracellular solute-binding protein [Catenulispora sp.]
MFPRRHLARTSSRALFSASSVAVAISVLAVSACSAAGGSGPKSSSGGGSGGDDTTITFLTFETPNLTPAYWDAAIKRVTDKYPGMKVKRLVSPTADRTSYAKQLKASGQFPDVMIAVTPTGFAQAGDLYAWQSSDLGDFEVPDGGAIGGKVYQLPANTQTIPMVYYRKSMFAKAGIANPPATYAEMLDDAAKLKAAGILPFQVGGGSDAFAAVLPLSATVATQVYRQDPNWLVERHTDKVKFSDPGFVDALQRVGDLGAKGYIDRSGLSRNYADSQKAFLDGTGAMYPMGVWFASAADASPVKDDIGVFAWPTDDGKLVMPAYTGGGLEVSAHAKNLEAAKKFALGFQLDKGNLDNNVLHDALFPAIKGYTPPDSTGPVFKESYDLYQKSKTDGTVVKAFSWEAGDDALIPGMTDVVYGAVEDVMLGKKSAKDAAASLDSEWSRKASS